jgi:hypothetical protein
MTIYKYLLNLNLGPYNSIRICNNFGLPPLTLIKDISITKKDQLDIYISFNIPKKPDLTHILTIGC